MTPFLQFHALAETRGEGLRPEFLDLFKRQAERAFINPLRSNDDAQQETKEYTYDAGGQGGDFDDTHRIRECR